MEHERHLLRWFVCGLKVFLIVGIEARLSELNMEQLILRDRPDRK